MLDAELYSENEPPPPDPVDANDPETLEKRRLDAELPGPSAIEGDPVSNSSPAQPPVPESTAPALGGDTPPSISASAASLLSALGADDSSQAAALSMFSADFRSLGAHMMAHTTKLKGYLEAIKPSSDPLVRYSALQELNELLVMSNEDTLSGYFQVDAFTKELIGILGGKRIGGDEEDDEEHEDDHDEDDEDSALAAALAMSGGSSFVGDENPEAQVLASRCLYNMMEALPGTAHTVVFHGAIPALCSKLLEIQFIDLAEQNISVSGVVFEFLFSLNGVF
jgi:E3 ubiquitin-protein ligase TRIP12